MYSIYDINIYIYIYVYICIYMELKQEPTEKKVLVSNGGLDMKHAMRFVVRNGGRFCDHCVPPVGASDCCKNPGTNPMDFEVKC